MNRIGAVIAKNRKKAGLSQGELAAKMNAFGFYPSVASVSSWEKDVSVPNALQFLALCSVLGIKDIYGEFAGEGNEENPMADRLNDEGRKKIREYTALLLLSEEYRAKSSDKAKPDRKTDGIKENKENIDREPVIKEIKEKPVRDVRILKIYNLPVSAGTGEFLDGEDYEEIEVGNEVPYAADFGLRIKGDSMEPRYRNGQTVWIRKCDSLEDGRIGIFLLNGNAYCKKLKKDAEGVCLVSLNPKYNPIKIMEDDEIKVFGQVLDQR